MGRQGLIALLVGTLATIVLVSQDGRGDEVAPAPNEPGLVAGPPSQAPRATDPTPSTDPATPAAPNRKLPQPKRANQASDPDSPKPWLAIPLRLRRRGSTYVGTGPLPVPGATLKFRARRRDRALAITAAIDGVAGEFRAAGRARLIGPVHNLRFRGRARTVHATGYFTRLAGTWEFTSAGGERGAILEIAPLGGGLSSPTGR